MSCYTPIYVKNKKYGLSEKELSTIPVPCGRCPKCLQRRTSSWVFRMQQEEKRSISTRFLTLTYSEDQVPFKFDRQTGELSMSLRKTDFQKYIKRVRKHSSQRDIAEPLKYYACGEYGSKTQRPHYHAIVFNGANDALESEWRLGHMQNDPAYGAAMAYVAKYINKPRMSKKDFRNPEFSLMSKGIGNNYLDPKIEKWHKEDLKRSYVVSPGGIKTAMPRYYRDKILTNEEKMEQAAIMEKLHSENEKKAVQAFAKRTGKPADYERSKAASVYQAFKNVEKTQSSKRTKL